LGGKFGFRNKSTKNCPRVENLVGLSWTSEHHQFFCKRASSEPKADTASIPPMPHLNCP
jgi:hypothetical protein